MIVKMSCFCLVWGHECFMYLNNSNLLRYKLYNTWYDYILDLSQLIHRALFEVVVSFGRVETLETYIII